MKKIFALALALLMVLSLGSVAMADTIPDVTGFTSLPLATVTFADTDGDNVYDAAPFVATVYPGAKIVLADSKWVAGDLDGFKAKADFASGTNTGAALVESVKINKDKSAVELKINENYTISDLKELTGVITLTRKGFTPIEMDIQMRVGNALYTVYGEKKIADAQDIPVDPVDDNTIYICDEDTPGYVAFSTDSQLLGVTLKMKAEEKAFMHIVENDEDIMDALEEEYPEAEIETYTFGGAPTFKNDALFTLQADYADQYYVYTYINGKLAEQDYDWNSEDGVYEWEDNKPRTYVISDTELVAAAEEVEETKNPDTGANDVVGVAAALAVVSLVAAGAVSLKK